MKKEYVIVTIIACYVMAIVVLLQLVQYVYLKIVDFLYNIQHDLDSIGVFRDLFAEYGCSSYSEFSLFISQHTPEAQVAERKFDALQQEIIFLCHHDPVGTLGVDPNVIMLCIFLPVLVLVVGFLIRSYYHYTLRKQRHERFMAEHLPDGFDPNSSMRYFDTTLGASEQIANAEYSTVVNEYVKLKRRCWTSESDKQLFKTVNRHTKRIVKSDGKTYPVAGLIMSTGKTLFNLGMILSITAFILESITLLLSDGSLVFRELSMFVEYFIIEHQFTAFGYILLMVPVGLILKMVARIIIQLKNDPVYYRLVIKCIVQGFNEDDMLNLNKVREQYNSSDMVLLSRQEVKSDVDP